MAISRSARLGRLSILCDNCLGCVEGGAYVKCGDCTADLCLPCFAAQAETPVHSKHHRYRVVCGMEARGRGDGWTVLDEMLLVEGVDACGIGNWAGVSEYVGRGKDVETHFHLMLGLREVPAGPGRESKGSSNPYRGCVSSYMPHRRDFDVEYMNGHEALVDALAVDGGGSEVRSKATEAILDSYMRIIKFRNRRKHVILDRNLVDMEGLRERDKDAEFVQDIKWITPYLTRSDFNVLFRGLYIERRLNSMLNKRIAGTTCGPEDTDPLLFLLSEREKGLCNACGMSPSTYLELKKEAFLCSARKGEFTRDDFNRLLGGLEHADVVYDFFVEGGWIGDKEIKET